MQIEKNNDEWRQQAVAYANIMSKIKWRPVAATLPNKIKGDFQQGVTQTGVPYSNGGYEGRMIGFDVSLKTFLAAVENPQSVLYTTNLRGQLKNSAAFYGMVCSAFTSYALQVRDQVGSLWQCAPHREGIEKAAVQSAQGATVGDILWNPGHVALITAITKNAAGRVTTVVVSESWPPTTFNRELTAEAFENLMAKRKAVLYNITDIAAWRGAESIDECLFPNYADDAAKHTINRELLLDLGDWVVYDSQQPVKFNVMDRDAKGVRQLVIKRGDQVVESVDLAGPTVIERTFKECGDYTAHCVLADGTASPACEFAISSLKASLEGSKVVIGQPWVLTFDSTNIKPLFLAVTWAAEQGLKGVPKVGHYRAWLTDEDRQQRKITVPADAFTVPGKYRVKFVGENRYGRLAQRQFITFVAP